MCDAHEVPALRKDGRAYHVRPMLDETREDTQQDQGKTAVPDTRVKCRHCGQDSGSLINLDHVKPYGQCMTCALKLQRMRLNIKYGMLRR